MNMNILTVFYDNFHKQIAAVSALRQYYNVNHFTIKEYIEL